MLNNKIQETVWSLVEYQSEDKNGNLIYPLGKNATGYIFFSKSNHLSVHIMQDPFEKNKKNIMNMMNTEVERKIRELGFHAYSGKFSINEENNLLTTDVELSLIPEYINSQQYRKIRFEGHSILHLSNVNHPERKLVWQKVEK